MSDSFLQNLDDETIGALNGGTAEGHHGNDLETFIHDPPDANISRGESFVSPGMYV